jgi:hypothetical protein
MLEGPDSYKAAIPIHLRHIWTRIKSSWRNSSLLAQLRSQINQINQINTILNQACLDYDPVPTKLPTWVLVVYSGNSSEDIGAC